MKKMKKQLTKTLNKNQILEEMFKVLIPATWIVNFEDGKTETSKTHESFLDISQERRDNITSFQLKIDDTRFIISNKTKDGELIKGFFYHVKEARKILMGAFQNVVLPFYAERIGFCYNNKGDSVVYRLDHSSLINKITQKMKIIGKMIDDNTPISKIDKLISKPIKYTYEADKYYENIVDVKLNIALFGKLNELKEMVTAPHAYMKREGSTNASS